jgi:putative (di)nucleoside polyphosphate hydrolase
MVAAPASQLPYRPNVGILLLGKDRKIFAAQRIDSIGTAKTAWQMPQGGIDQGEDARAAAFREMKEEIGTDNARVLAESTDWIPYDLPAELIGKVLGGKYRGQKQKWFAMEFLGTDDEINIHTEEPEFHTWEWVTPGFLLSNIVEFKRETYGRVFEEFAKLLNLTTTED